MTSITLNVIFFFTSFSLLNASYIEKDTPITPIIYKPVREIEFEMSKAEFSYSINLSIITDLKIEFTKKISRNCNNSPHLNQLHQNLFAITKIWNQNRTDTIPVKNIIDLTPYDLQTLKTDLFLYRNEKNNNVKCELLNSFSEHLHTFDSELKKIEKLSFSTLTNIIPMTYLLKHAFNFTSHTNLTHALDFTHWFTTNFYKYSEFEYSMKNNFAFITIKIPLFSHTQLLKIFPKPILHDSTPYIFNSKSEYLVENEIGLNFFNNINENCFYANNRTFCKKPKSQNNCDNQYVGKTSTKFNRECFTRLQYKNIITQIQNDLYFTVIEPLTISVSCDGSTQTIEMLESSRILNNNCIINSTFFQFNPKSPKEYGIYFSKINLRYEKYNSMTQLLCLILFIIFYLIILSTITYFSTRKQPRNPLEIMLETQV